MKYKNLFDIEDNAVYFNTGDYNFKWVLKDKSEALVFAEYLFKSFGYVDEAE